LSFISSWEDQRFVDLGKMQVKQEVLGRTNLPAFPVAMVDIVTTLNLIHIKTVEDIGLKVIASRST
jgi:hypothetical protein